MDVRAGYDLAAKTSPVIKGVIPVGEAWVRAMDTGIADKNPMETMLLREYDGTHFLRADAKAIAAWLPAEEGSSVQDRIYLIDPLGHLMMRYSVDADPGKMKKDITKLLKASSIG